MNKSLQVLRELRELSGNAQILHLQYNKSDLLKEILEYTYDPHKKFKIEEGKYNKFDQEVVHVVRSNFTVDDWNYFKEKLDHLVSLPSAKDEDVSNIVSFINDFDNEYRDFMKKVLFKDLRLNMSVKKFQKIWSGFCEQPQVQLAGEWQGQIFERGLYSRKFDGKRMYIKDGVPYSRSNIVCSIPPVSHILEQLSMMLIDNSKILDGECLYFDAGKEDFKKGISLCQSKERKSDCDKICYVIFDIIDKDKFLSKQPDNNFEYNYSLMLQLYADTEKPTLDYSLIPTKFDNIFIARQDHDMTMLSKLCKERNWEGLMYRNADCSYEYKRSNNLLKIKEMKDLELKLVDMQEGTGRHEGRLGAFIVEYEGNVVKIGSGFSDYQRNIYWNNKDKYVGNFVKVQYFEKTINQEGLPSLRFPVFLCFRNLETGEEFLEL